MSLISKGCRLEQVKEDNGDWLTQVHLEKAVKMEELGMHCVVEIVVQLMSVCCACLYVDRKSLQARLKRPSFRSEKEKRDKESKSNSSSLGSLREGDLITNTKVVNFTTNRLFKISLKFGSSCC